MKVELVDRVLSPETARRQIAMAREFCRDPQYVERTRSLVKNVITDRDDRFLAAVSESLAVCTLLRARLPYRFDPVQTEMVYHPKLVMDAVDRPAQSKVSGEDCDSFAGLTHAMLCALGRQSRITLLAFAADRPFKHIVAEVFLPPSSTYRFPGRWLIVDPALSEAEARESASRVKRARFFYPDGKEQEIVKRG